MAGSYSKISAGELYIEGTQSLQQMLQGKLAGVDITNVSGMVGSCQTTKVRETSTILGNQEPIWVVDGINKKTLFYLIIKHFLLPEILISTL